MEGLCSIIFICHYIYLGTFTEYPFFVGGDVFITELVAPVSQNSLQDGRFLLLFHDGLRVSFS